MNASWWPRRWRARATALPEALWFGCVLLLWRSNLGAPGSRRGVGVFFSRWGFDLFVFARGESAGLPKTYFGV